MQRTAAATELIDPMMAETLTGGVSEGVELVYSVGVG
jgi:hypothetical protein